MSTDHKSAKLKPFDASDYHVGVVVAQFNSHITKPMLDEVLKKLKQFKVKTENISVIKVAGAADIPAALESLARNDLNKCLITLGAIIRGETAHFDYVAKIATDAVKDVAIKHAKPVAFGILTVDTEEQATSRVAHAGEYAEAALHAAKSIKEVL